ncbi:MAG: fatty acid desaturase [Anaerolineales bacterium]|jgi:omega-6 fatty acid desaturase (delta-12 desaturase)
MSAKSDFTTRDKKNLSVYRAVAKYTRPDLRRAIWQILNTFIPYIALWVLMVVSIKQGYSYWITLALSVVAAALLVRIFILFHDCCHGSFFASRKANRILGYVSGILTFTPFEQWRHSHAVHHATVGDLDRRGVGDVWTLTVEEYQNAPWWQRVAYRVYRHPLIMFGIGPGVAFFFAQRLPAKGAKKRERRSVMLTNLAIILILVAASLTIGIRTYLLIQVPVMMIAGAVGVWLFYVQHQFEGVYWARHESWEPLLAALQGSSYYKLPKIVQWFTGSIGFHHIHHIQPRIPNYNLQACYDNTPGVQQDQPLTLRKSLACIWMNLWDEKQQKLVSFGSLRAG